MTLPMPYYQDESVTLYYGDSRDILPALEPASVDLVLTDPPFFMPATHYQTRTRQQRTWGDTSILATFWARVLDDALPALKRTGHCLTFCHGESYPVFYPEMYRRFDTLACLVWDKQRIGMGRVWRRRHELIIAGRWQEAVFFDDGVTRADVLTAKASNAADREHPVEKPTILLADLIRPTTTTESVILDPFAGSGTTLEAAKQLGRRAIGIEIEERYCDVIARRMAQAVLPLGAD